MPKLKSFEGTRVGRCVLVEEPGPKDAGEQRTGVVALSQTTDCHNL